MDGTGGGWMSAGRGEGGQILFFSGPEFPPSRNWKRGKDPHPHTLSLTKDMARFTKG